MEELVGQLENSDSPTHLTDHNLSIVEVADIRDDGVG